MQTIQWEVTYRTPPKTTFYCKKCGAKTQYASSGLFRVNAQQKYLDIWLIYKCVACESSWKLTVFSRIHPNSLPTGLLERFTQNDRELAQQYAMDMDWLKRNGAETEAPAFCVQGEAPAPGQPCRIRVTSRYPAKVRVAKILRQKLGLSAKAFEALAAGGLVRLENGGDIRRQRLHQEAVVLYM